MENETYETYEYLASNTVVDYTPESRVEEQQFFIVQDGTFLDHFVLSNDESDLYNNGFLLQSTSSTSHHPTSEAKNVVVENAKTKLCDEIEFTSSSDNMTTDVSEVTLTDENYQMLQTKGWVLLDLNEKIYLLNTLGLHDITKNTALIQKLKNEFHGNNSMDIQCDEIQVPLAAPLQYSSADLAEYTNNTIQFENMQNVLNVNQTVTPMAINNQSQDESKGQQKVCVPSDSTHIEHTDETRNTTISTKMQSNKIIKLKTNLVFKDIPDKVVLGKTKNGKNLIARFVKIKPEDVKEPTKPSNDHHPNTHIKKKSNTSIVSKQNVNKCEDDSTSDFPDVKLESLIIQSLLDADPPYNAKDIATAESVIKQLCTTHVFKSSIVKRNLFISKIVDDEAEEEAKETLVTGRVLSVAEGSYEFIHMPDLIYNLMLASADERPESYNNCDSNLHVRIEEIKEDSDVRLSVSLTKFKLPLISIKKQMKTLGTKYACGACAKVFHSENGLKNHQTNCLDDEGNLAEDIKGERINHNRLTENKEEAYSCNQCNAKFNRFSNRQRHMKTHTNPKVESRECSDKLSSSVTKKHQPMYECKLCSCSFIHRSTLTKHILNKHIKH